MFVTIMKTWPELVAFELPDNDHDGYHFSFLAYSYSVLAVLRITTADLGFLHNLMWEALFVLRRLQHLSFSFYNYDLETWGDCQPPDGRSFRPPRLESLKSPFSLSLSSFSSLTHLELSLDDPYPTFSPSLPLIRTAPHLTFLRFAGSVHYEQHDISCEAVWQKEARELVEALSAGIRQVDLACAPPAVFLEELAQLLPAGTALMWVFYEAQDHLGGLFPAEEACVAVVQAFRARGVELVREENSS
ncbi:hypothetical protein JCM8547_002048 [Rhodosporidiobolus lusitaniae]